MAKNGGAMLDSDMAHTESRGEPLTSVPNNKYTTLHPQGELRLDITQELHYNLNAHLFNFTAAFSTAHMAASPSRGRRRETSHWATGHIKIPPSVAS